jgi:hypothetical protein
MGRRASETADGSFGPPRHMITLRTRVRIFRCAPLVTPRGHVVLVGQPRAGRTDLIAALGKVFEVDPSRLDKFHGRDRHGGTEDLRPGREPLVQAHDEWGPLVPGRRPFRSLLV